MKKICFITGTRADYGILSPIIRNVNSHPEIETQIIATNMHLSPLYGMTVNEIRNDGFKVNREVESLVEGGTSEATVRSMAKVQMGLAEALKELTPDLVVILGDRYEALASASAAVCFNIPVAHLHGGEITQGAIDDKFRNAITQLSTYHFAATPEYANRIVSMVGNTPNVFHSGAPGAEISEVRKDESVKEEFFEKTGLSSEDKFIILAIHPVTLAEDKGGKDVEETLKALDCFINKGFKVLITMPNSDPGNIAIREKLLNWKNENPKYIVAVNSLGSRLFHYAMSRSEVMIGNSSSALIEAPSLRLPAINVGDRQKGRAHGISVINVIPDRNKIKEELIKVLSPEFKIMLDNLEIEDINPYYKKDSVDYISSKLIEFLT